jgi:transcriptional regulator with XRE-family HTH domain
MWKKQLRSLLREAIGNQVGTDGVSLRSFAKSAGMSPGSVSEIIHGKRSLSDRAAKQLLFALNLPDEVKNEYLELIEKESSGTRRLLGPAAEVLLSDAFFTAILCLFELPERPLTRDEISLRLGLPPAKTDWAVDHLLSLNMLKANADGTLELRASYWTTTDQIASSTVREAHHKELDLAGRALDRVDFQQRDFTSITFVGNSRHLERVRKEIRRFRDRVSQIIAEGECDQVYKLNIQLFPMDGFGLGGEENPS